MISLDSVEQSIEELENKDTSFATCERLAWLYIVRDHLRGYNVSPETAIKISEESEFLKAINGKNPNSVFPIINELMDAVYVFKPVLYEKTIQKLKEIGGK